MPVTTIVYAGLFFSADAGALWRGLSRPVAVQALRAAPPPAFGGQVERVCQLGGVRRGDELFVDGGRQIKMKVHCKKWLNQPLIVDGFRFWVAMFRPPVSFSGCEALLYGPLLFPGPH